MKYVYKNTKSTFTGWTIPADCVEITDEQYQALLDGSLVWENDELVEHTKTIEEINAETRKANIKAYRKELAEIKAWLSDNDWKVNKHILGEWDDDDTRWLEYIQERKLKRARFDELDALIKGE